MTTFVALLNLALGKAREVTPNLNSWVARIRNANTGEQLDGIRFGESPSEEQAIKLHELGFRENVAMHTPSGMDRARNRDWLILNLAVFDSEEEMRTAHLMRICAA
jgi:hypothetical protein